MIALEKTRTVVTIGGKDYSFLSTEGTDYVFRVAKIVNDRIDRINKEYVGLSTITMNMMVAISLAEDILATQAALYDVKRELKTITSRFQQVKELNVLFTNQRKEQKKDDQDLYAMIEKLENKINQLEEEKQALEAANEKLSSGVTTYKVYSQSGK